MKKIKVSEATGAALDWLVLVALYGKHDPHNADHIAHFIRLRTAHVLHRQTFYSENWADGGPIIAREHISINVNDSGCWVAYNQYNYADEKRFCSAGATPLIAAMRCYVTSKLGSEAEVPEELA